VVSVVTNFLWCVIGFLQTYNGAVTAIATIAIGAFTFALVRVTNRQARLTKEAVIAANVQADTAKKSLTDIERPYLFVFNVGRLNTEEIVEIDIEEQDSGDGLLLSVTYSLANYGKIPAIIKHAQSGLSAGADPETPERVPYSHTLITAPIVAAGEIRNEITQYLRWQGDYGNDEDGSLVPTLKDDSTLFFWVIVMYRGPFTDQHETRACWRYDKSTGRFIGPHGGPEYSGEK